MFFFRPIPVLFSLVYILAHLSNYLTNGASTSNKLLSRYKLFRKSFSIRSTISKFTPEGLRQEARLFEQYSADQQRARIDFDTPNEDGQLVEESFYYDSKTNLGLFFYAQTERCGSGNRKELNEYLFGQAPMHELENMLDDNLDLGHIVGPAKLLFLIASQADQMRGSEKASPSIRNIPVVQFDLELPLMNDGGKVSFNVFYDQSALQQESLETSVPIYVCIWFPKHGFLIDFYTPQMLVPNLVRSSLSNKFNDKILDQFAYPISHNCTRYLQSTLTGDLFEKYDMSAITFSFRSLSSVSGLVLEHFVAFNGFTQTMRIDSSRITRRESQNGHENFVLFDLRSNRRYSMFENKQAQIQRMQLVEELQVSSEPKENNCVVTEAFESATAKRPSLASLILGAKEFVFMGMAQVRGMDAKVYESSTERLPFWISESFAFKTKDGYSSSRERFARMQDKATGDKYSVVVYIADKSQEQSSGLNLLLIEVYGRNLVMSQIYDFIWNLNESPSGDSVQELFSHKELCSSAGGNRYAQVSVLLQEDEEKADKNVAGKDLNWLKNWPARTRALVSSFRDVMDVQTIMMQDVESQLFMDERSNRRSIAASFRVSEPPQFLHSIEFVGYARLRDAGFHTGAFTFTECLWMVGHRNYPVYILFDEFMEVCALKIDLSKTPLLGLNDSSILELADYYAEVYKVSPEPDHEVSLNTSWLRDKKLNHLESRAMILQNVLHDDVSRPIDSNDLKVRIKSIKMRHVSYMSDREESAGDRSRPPVASYAGFGLSPRLDEKSRLITKTTKSSESDDEEDLNVSQAQCQAACLSDPTCRVYSYCVRRALGECITSSAIFSGSSIDEQLNSASVATLKSGSTFNAQLLFQEMELVKDNRCELFNKIYMDSFIRDGTRKVWPGMFKISPVSGEEQCAEICFTDNLETIRLGAAKSDEIMRLVHKEALDIRMESDQLKGYYKEFQKKFCSSFNYLSSSLDPAKMKALKELSTGNLDGDAEPNGYCFIKSVTNSPASPNQLDFYVTLDSYQFDFTSLFEKRAAISLSASDESRAVLSAYYAKTRGKAKAEDLEKVIQGLRGGKNFALVLDGVKPASCAMDCFFQSSSLWPACRSFDTFSSWLGDHIIDMCQLNTVSMEQPNFNRSLIKQADWEIETVAHYEPRFRPLRELIANTFAIDNFLDQIVSKKSGSLTIGSFGMLLILVASLASGIMLGIKLAQKYLIVSAEGRNGLAQNRTILVDALELERANSELNG